ncbi:MAG: hypothetical protein ACXABO_18745 [Promethearchaeota archaeon]|jgi:hypothetical protein
MSNEIEEAEMINKYLCQIKKSLPLGIRLNKNELNDIIDEIEEHLWELAIENAGDKEPNENDVQIAITQMGEPQSIASKFTSRSTPQVYISEELYPTYRKYRKSLFWASVLFFLIYTLLFSFYFTFPSFSLIFIAHFIIIGMYLTSNVILSMVFCYLSMTGYIPFELRKSKIQKRYSNIAQIQKPKFKSQSQILILWLEIIFFLITAIFIGIVFWSGLFIYFIIISIIKTLRGFAKTKSVNWQRSLILADMLFMCLLFLVGEKEIYSLFFADLYTISDYLLFISIISALWIAFFLYIYYEMHIFITFKEKQELYLKELSLIKRMNKKEIIIGTLKNPDSPSIPNNALNNQPLSIKSSEINFEYEEIIRSYLHSVKKKLPFWLRKVKKQDIINNLEEEIQEAILDFEEKTVLNLEILENYLLNLESTKAILSEYKQRGIPKIFISKELWPWYLTTLKSVVVYFLIVSIFTSVVQMIFDRYFISFIFYGTHSFYFILWYFWILTPILATKLFTFLSLNDFIPQKSKIFGTKKKTTPKFNSYKIWEALFAGFFIILGTVLIFLVLFRNFSTFLLESNLLFTISCFLLLLAFIKILKIAINHKKVIIKSVLIILSLVNSLIIQFIILFDFHSQYPIIIIYYFPFLPLLSLLLVPINIEIIYEAFHFFSIIYKD